MVDPNIVSPQLIEFLAGIATGYFTKKGENILEKSTDKILESLKKKLGKDEFEKIKGMNEPRAKEALKALIKKKHLRKEVHAFYVIYKYLEKFTEDSQFLRVMDFRRGEGIPLDRMYVKLQIIEEQKKKDQLATSRYYEEDYYYQAKEKWMRSEEHSRKINPDEITTLDKGIVCILGLPGAGKTTLCKYFCWKTLKGDYAKQRFPIYIELRGIEKDEDPVTYAFYSKLKEHFTKKEIGEAVATIKHNTDIFSPLYVFDGLDEVKIEHGKISESIRNCADSSLCIVTSRRSGFIYLQHDRTYEILPLGRDEKEEFVKNYFTQIEEVEKVESFLHVLEKREYDSLSKNPLLLSILCALASDTEDVKTLPSRRSGLYKRIVAKMNEWHKFKGGKGLSQEEIRALEDLALSLFLKKRPKILFDKGIDKNVLKKAAKVGLIYRWDELRYSFLHLTLQEYFAACSLRSLKKEWKGIMREKKDVVSWHEILQLFASILSEEEEYEELKEFFSIILESPDILHLSFALAGHCLAEIDMDYFCWFDEILGKVFHKFEKNQCESSFIEAFVRLGEKAVDPLLDLLEKTDDDGLKWSISEILGRIRDPRALDPLLGLLEKTDDGSLLWRISETLGRIGDPRAVDPLLNLLEETGDNDLREKILFALGILGDPRAVDPLLGLLERTDDDELKWSILKALGRIRDPRAVDSLLNLLEKTDDNYLKGIVSFALGILGDPKAVDPLLDLLEKIDDNNLKWRISETLGRIGDSRAVDPLLSLLERTDDNLLKRAISEALDEIEGPETIDHLLELLERMDSDTMLWRISFTLGRIGDSKALDPLLARLEIIDDNYLKGRISLGLGKIGDSKAVDPLLDLLERTDDDYLKMRISFALGEIGDSRAVDPLLDLLEKTSDDDLIWETSLALGKIGEKAVDPLLELLERTENDDLRDGILLALGEIGDPRALDPLLDLLEVTDSNYLKGQISLSLAGIGDPRAVGPLLELLEEINDDFVAEQVSEALDGFNPLYLYPFIENHILQPEILYALCRFSTEFNIRFFKDKVVLPEGDILYIKTEAQRKQAIKKLDKVLKGKK